MHPFAVIAVVNSIQRRAAQGDCPTEPEQPREILEETVLELFRQLQRRKIMADPNDEPTAGDENRDADSAPEGRK